MKKSSPAPVGRHLHFEPGFALRDSLRQGYRFSDLRHDLLAAIVVGTVALPLSMALAIASGVPPQYGLYTAVVAGSIIALLGGSHFQVSGPTAAFVVILAPITQQFGLTGLLMATLMAGIIQLLMGLGGLGKLIQFIPYPVTTGFTAGIAVVIATLQLRDFFGLTITTMPDHYFERVLSIAAAWSTTRLGDTAVGLLTLLILIVSPRLTRKIPGPLIALPIAGLAAYFVMRWWPGTTVATIDSAFGGVPRALPAPHVPWSAGESGAQVPTFRLLLGPAFAIAILGAIESLLSAVIADGMTGKKHDPDAELVAQGVGNIVAPFFGGIAATGAIARTATNIRSGARSPFAAFFHAVFVLAVMLLLAPVLGRLPMAGLAALLLVVAWNMSEAKHALRVMRVGPRSDALVLATCFALTVIFDMVIAVSAGVVLAALLFMRRMAELATFELVGEGHPGLAEPLPPRVRLYDIAGPMFFGAAQKAVSALRTVGDDVRVVVLDLRDVPTMDTTGLINLESAIQGLNKARISVVVAGVQHQPLHLMARAGWHHRPGVVVRRSFEDGMSIARRLAETETADPTRPEEMPASRTDHSQT